MAVESIASTLQNLADAVSMLVGLQVDVVNERLVRVAKAGTHADAIGVEPSEGQVYRRALLQGKPVVVDMPRRKGICRTCKHRMRCRATGQIVWPILRGQRVVGCVGCTAVTEDERQLLFSQYQRLAGLLGKLSELIGWGLAESERATQLSVMAEQFWRMMDYVSEGVMVLDRGRRAIFMNRAAQRVLGVEAPAPGAVVSSPEVDECLERGRELAESPLTFRVPGRAVNCIGTVRLIRPDGSNDGVFCLFKEAELEGRLAGRLRVHDLPCTFDDILGVSNAILAVKDCARRVASGDSTVLLLGESGTGKELFARAIHSASRRARGPFIAVNCGAIPETLLESELFGYEEGAFTGARKGGKPGKFELATGGTIFLDEIGDLPLPMQVKLLRVLEARSVERLGGTKSIPVDVRVVAATNSDLQELVSAGKFRRDLYYRINVVALRLPPLRDRPEDIEHLARAFVGKYAQRLGRQVTGISEEALRILKAYSWPGNVRELQNVIEYAVNLERGTVITPASLPAEVLMPERGRCPAVGGLRSLELEAIKAALDVFGNDGKGKRAAAEALGIHLSTLYRKLKRYQH